MIHTGKVKRIKRACNQLSMIMIEWIQAKVHQLFQTERCSNILLDLEYSRLVLLSRVNELCWSVTSHPRQDDRDERSHACRFIQFISRFPLQPSKRDCLFCSQCFRSLQEKKERIFIHIFNKTAQKTKLLNLQIAMVSLESTPLHTIIQCNQPVSQPCHHRLNVRMFSRSILAEKGPVHWRWWCGRPTLLQQFIQFSKGNLSKNNCLTGCDEMSGSFVWNQSGCDGCIDRYASPNDWHIIDVTRASDRKFVFFFPLYSMNSHI